MTNLKYTVVTFEKRAPSGLGIPPQGEWFYYEVALGGSISLSGYRLGTREEVEQVVAAVVERLNRDKPGTPPIGSSSRLIFPVSSNNEDEDGNLPEDDDTSISQEHEG